MEWIVNNVEWIFSGIGVAVASLLFGVFFKKRSRLSQKQSSGSNSVNIQSGGNVFFGKEKDER